MYWNMWGSIDHYVQFFSFRKRESEPCGNEGWGSKYVKSDTSSLKRQETHFFWFSLCSLGLQWQGSRRLLPGGCPISLYAIRHIRLWHSLSIHYGLLRGFWHSPMTATPLFSSSSTILLHVVLGRPGLLFPSGLHSRDVTQCSSLSFLVICPIQFHLLRLISSLVLFTPVFS